ncbi:MAG: PilZ domain-containing protein [Nannocystaceae bacterium]|nr:PilZ domain-containing protein [Nannocystaceae bacterium]
MIPPRPHTAERRAFERVRHTGEAALATGRGEVLGKILNVSIAGLGVETSGTLRLGEFVRVRLALGQGAEDTQIDPDAFVARVEPSTRAGRSIVGLSFYDLSPATLTMLSDQVADSLG